MHWYCIVLIVSYDIAEFIKVIAQIFVVIVEEKKLNTPLWHKFFQSGEKHLLFFDKMDIQMLTDILTRFEHNGIVASLNRSPIPLAFKPLDHPQQIVTGMTECLVLGE